MPSYINELDELAGQFGTDKCTVKVSAHAPKGYTDIYHRYFGHYRSEPLTILEIGVSGGASLKMWEAYFYQSVIHAIDINPNCLHLQTDRSKVYIGDQTDIGFLRSVVDSAGGSFDIIIDDGGHEMEQHQVSLETLFPVLSPGGIYVIEDLHTAYSKDYGGGLLKPKSTIEYLKRLIDSINGGASGEKLKPELYGLESIHFYLSMAFLTKKFNQ